MRFFFTGWRARRRAAARLVLLQLDHFRKVEAFMADLTAELADVKATLDSVVTNIGNIGLRLQAQADQIAALTEQLQNAGTLSADQQTALDGIRDEAASIASATAALVPPTA